MAREKEPVDPEVEKLKADKKQFKEEQKQQKKEQKARKKEAKKKAKELADEEARIMEDDAGGLPVFITTVVIILVWVAIICALIKLDVGGFGSGVLAPVLKNVPVVNKILPNSNDGRGDEDVDVSGYSSLREAVRKINDLEIENSRISETNTQKDLQIAALQEEVTRLKTFEEKQVEFERIKNQFYNEVVYAEKGPGAEEYSKYYESMDPATAEVLYKQVVAQQKEDELVKNYAQAYSEMKSKDAAEIFENMKDNLDLVAKILWQMEPDVRGNILGVMDAELAAKITKIMEPD